MVNYINHRIDEVSNMKKTTCKTPRHGTALQLTSYMYTVVLPLVCSLSSLRGQLHTFVGSGDHIWIRANVNRSRLTNVKNTAINISTSKHQYFGSSREP